jgi:ssDNA-binding Zn-finger/Zn-ribbon topoisomerase 1
VAPVKAKLLSNIKTILAEGDFDPNPSILCAWCGFNEICDDAEAYPSGFGRRKSCEEEDEPDDPAVCPRCGGELEEREGRHGSFIGCSEYPECRYTRDDWSITGPPTTPRGTSAQSRVAAPPPNQIALPILTPNPAKSVTPPEFKTMSSSPSASDTGREDSSHIKIQEEIKANKQRRTDAFGLVLAALLFVAGSVMLFAQGKPMAGLGILALGAVIITVVMGVLRFHAWMQSSDSPATVIIAVIVIVVILASAMIAHFL